MKTVRILHIMAVVVCLLHCHGVSAHASWKEHVDDMYAVLGFERSDEITEWMRFISSDMIDNCNADKAYVVNGKKVGFYDYLKAKYPPFKCKHRLLFHWGYNSRPWNNELQQKVEQYGWSADKIKIFQQELINEQKRRNSKANAYTERLFGLASGGKQAARARALISIAYDVHLIGDYMPDNKDIDGLSSLSSVVGDLINNIRVLDKVNSKALISKIQKESRKAVNDQVKAANIMSVLKGQRLGRR